MRMRDLETKNDIEDMLQVFYRKAFADDLIGHFFTEVVPLDLETHIPVIAAFWESIIFNTQSYRKNVMQVHEHISSLSPIRKEHLDRWVRLFRETVDETFQGPHAELMKQRAQSVATLMDIKINHKPLNKRI